jgi:2,3-bisphosphoglycerate-dependent phosphoglycerate mutase
MTHIYFVRHALPEHNWEEDRTRPLTEEGFRDSKKVTEAMKDIHLNYAICSPYRRSIDTIRECVEGHGLVLKTEERFRERQRGKGNSLDMLFRRWEDFNFHEEGGESLGMVQRRNIEAFLEVLKEHNNDAVIIGTHGTALSSILSYFDPSYNRDSFLRIVNYMPYIIRLDFDGSDYIRKEELLIVDKNYTEYNKNYKKKALANGLEKCSCVRVRCERYGKCDECIEHHKTHKRYPLPYCQRKKTN